MTSNPKLFLVGFKLLVDVSQAELVQVAQAALVKKIGVTFVLANDLMNVHETEHEGLLINRNGHCPRSLFKNKGLVQ